MFRHGKRMFLKSTEAPDGNSNRIPGPANPSGVAATPQTVMEDGELPLNLKPPTKEFTKPTRISLENETEGTASHVLLSGK